MKQNNSSLWFICLFLIAVTSLGNQSHFSDFERLQAALSENMGKLESCSFLLSKKEKMRGKWVEGSSYVTNNLVNQKINIRTISPRANILVEYPYGMETQAQIHLDFFPYLTGRFSPCSSLLLRDQHHPISHVTPVYFVKIIEKYLATCNPPASCQIQELENDTISVCFSPSQMPSHTHVVKTETSIIGLSDSLLLNPYRIYELNDSKIDYDEIIAAGETIELPPYYADKAIFWLSKEHLLPQKVQFYLGDSLYEEYQFSNYKLQWKPE